MLALNSWCNDQQQTGVQQVPVCGQPVCVQHTDTSQWRRAQVTRLSNKYVLCQQTNNKSIRLIQNEITNVYRLPACTTVAKLIETGSSCMKTSVRPSIHLSVRLSISSFVSLSLVLLIRLFVHSEPVTSTFMSVLLVSAC